MDAARWQRLDAIFQQALDRPPQERIDFVQQTCGGDPSLADEVLAMLAADGGTEIATRAERDGADPLAGIVRAELERPTEDGIPTAARSEGDLGPKSLPFPNLGVYRLIEEVGRGGLATVYSAERDDNQFSMTVAIKLVRRGLDTPDLLERLRLERQILARLEHPNIARLIDGGTAPDGRPYFVMEFIEGERIDRWCAEQQLDLRQRLELFQSLCDAVHTAHRRLVLHRDIKPSNILVTRQGVPKLLDFGIAKVLDAHGDEAEALTRVDSTFSPLTGTGMRLLTPEFASPEQVRGDNLTTASDTYSLGVLLYHLITGAAPYDLDRRRPSEIERVVSEVTPRRPSDVVADDPPRRRQLGWPRRLGGDDLDLVVLKALRKEPDRRYGSANRLAEDLSHYLEDQPVSARPDTLRYRTGKFLSRHRTPVLAACALLVVLVAAVVTTSWQAILADRARQVAEHQRAEAIQQRTIAERQQRRAEETSTFLVDLFQVADPYRTASDPLTVREILDRGAVELRVRLDDDPLLRAHLLGTIGQVYQNLSQLDASESLLQEAVDLLEQELPPGDPRILSAHQSLARLRIDQERFQDAEDILRRLIEPWRLQEDPAALAQALFDLAAAQRGLGRLDAAETLLNEVIALQLGLGDPLEVARARNGLSALRRQQKDYAAAEAGQRDVLDIRRRLLGEDHPEVAHTMNDLAVTLQQRGELEMAESLYRETLAMQRRLFGDRHHHVITALNNLVSVLFSQSKIEEALELNEQQSQLIRDLYGSDHPSMARALYFRSQLYRASKDIDAALPLAQRSWQIHRDHFGKDHPNSLRSDDLWTSLLVANGDAEAEPRLRRQLSTLRNQLGPDDDRVAHPLANLARLRMAQGRLEEAETFWRQALSIQERALPAGDWHLAATRGRLGDCLRQLERFEEAEGLLRSSYRDLVHTFGEDHPRPVAVAKQLAALAQAKAAVKNDG